MLHDGASSLLSFPAPHGGMKSINQYQFAWINHMSQSRGLFELKSLSIFNTSKVRAGKRFVWQEWGSQSASDENVRHPSLSTNECLIEKACLPVWGWRPFQNYLYPSTSAAGRVWNGEIICWIAADWHTRARCFNFIELFKQNDWKQRSFSSLSLKLLGDILSRRECISASIRAKVCLSNRRGGGIIALKVCLGHTLKCLLDMRPSRQAGLHNFCIKFGTLQGLFTITLCMA